MKNKKGFTLIETLIIIIILAILLGIAVPSITKLLKRGTNEYYHSIENEIKASGMDYLETYRTLLPRQIGNVTVIDLKELVDNKYIDEIKDEEGNLCTGKITAKKIDSGTYEYYSCLKCGNSYNSKEENCEYTEYDNTYVDQHLYNITVDKYSYTVNQGDSFNLPLGKVYYNGQLINDKLEGNPSKIDTDILGTTEVIYFYNGAKKVVTVEVIDKTKPTKPEVVLKKNNANGQTYLSSTWFSGDIYQLFKSTDYTTPGVMGSGIKKYQISTDGTNFNDLTGNTKIDTQNGSRKYYVRSVDNNNNISNVNNYVIKIDKEIPKCELEVKSGTLGINGWWTSDLTIGFKSTTETVSSLVHASIDITSVTKDTASTTATGTVIDEAGNVGTCKITVKMDETHPGCTDNGNFYAWTGSNRTLTYGCSDNLSGCHPSHSGGSATVSWTTITATVGAYTVMDNAGNTTTCPARTAYVYVDKTAPSCTYSGDYSSWTSGNRTFYHGCSDGESGCHGSYSGGATTVNWTTSTVGIAAYTIMDNVGNATTCPARTAYAYVDKSKPSCSTSKTSTGTTIGVGGTISCSDSGSGCSTSNQTSFSGLKSSATYTVKDKVGNSSTCSVTVTPQDQYRYKTCAAYTTNGTVCGYETKSYQILIEPGCVQSAQYTTYMKACACGTSNQSTCQYYNAKSCVSAGCSSWGSWSGWSTNMCYEKANAVTCGARTVYY